MPVLGRFESVKYTLFRILGLINLAGCWLAGLDRELAASAGWVSSVQPLAGLPLIAITRTSGLQLVC